jgi:ornithine cyclodeaminase/alanine dehydrogenase-like protein (mu-crystallin family)
MTSPKLLVINHAALQEIITLAETIEIVDQAMRELSVGLVAAPERSVMSVNAATRLGLMPGAMPSLARFGVKVVSLSADAASFGLPSHQGLMLLFDSGTGQPLAALDCHALTRMRTAAASAVAARALARRDAKVLAIIGPGDLAGPHLDASNRRSRAPTSSVPSHHRQSRCWKGRGWSRASISIWWGRACALPARWMMRRYDGVILLPTHAAMPCPRPVNCCTPSNSAWWTRAM